ncbi:MAG: VWA domain-containing protein [Dermatophilaceae bacterium]
MTDQNLTHLYFLLDRSGSMESIRTDIEGGFSAFINEQRTQTGACRVTLAKFDDHYEEVYRDLPVAEVPDLDLQPRGTTALLDSIGRLVSEAGTRLAALPEEQRPGNVIVAIMTDGQENASRELTHPAIKAMIERQSTDYGWQFLFMGSDQDAIEVGASIGIARDNSLTYSRGQAAVTMAMTSRKISRYRQSRAAGASVNEARVGLVYSDEDRAAATE